MSDAVPAPGVPIEPPAPDKAAQARAGTTFTIARNSMWLGIDMGLSMAAAFYCSVAVARGLGPDRMGEYNYVLWFASVLRMVTEFAIPSTFRKFAAELLGRGDFPALKTLVRFAFKIQMRMAIVGVAASLAIVLFSMGPERRLIATLAVLTVVPALLMSIPSGVLQATEDLLPNVIGSLLATLTNTTGITLSVISHWGLIGIMISLMTSRFVDCIVRFTLFRRVYVTFPGEPIKGPFDRVLLKRLIRFAASQMVLMVFQILLWERMEVFFIRRLSAVREIAFFSLSITVVQYVLTLPSVLAGSVGATMMVQQGRAPHEVARIAGTAVWFTVLVATPALFGVAAVSDPLLHLVYGVKYLPVIPVLTVMALFALTQAVQFPIGPFLLATEQQKFIIFWATVMVVVNISVCYLLIPHMGALGAAYARGLCHLVGVIGFLVFMVRKLGVKLPLGKMARPIIVCTAMFLAVRGVAGMLHAVPALLVGIPTGCLIFVLLTRILRCLDNDDRDRLSQMKRLLPARARGPYLSLVDFVVRA